MKSHQVGRSTDERPTLYQRIKDGLALAAGGWVFGTAYLCFGMAAYHAFLRN